MAAPISLRLASETLEAIDRARGDDDRSTWIRGAIARALPAASDKLGSVKASVSEPPRDGAAVVDAERAAPDEEAVGEREGRDSAANAYDREARIQQIIETLKRTKPAYGPSFRRRLAEQQEQAERLKTEKGA